MILGGYTLWFQCFFAAHRLERPPPKKCCFTKQGETAETFIPSYITILHLLDEEDSIARKAGAKPGDCIVCVNGKGYRRFAPEYRDEELEHLYGKYEPLTEEQIKLRATTLTGFEKSEHYFMVLQAIKDIKGAADPERPLVLQLERYGWDSKVHSFGRFLAFKDGNVVDALGMLERHEQWRSSFFPVDLTPSALQHTISLNAISEVCINEETTPTLYVNYQKLLDAIKVDASTRKHLMLVDFAALKRLPTVDDVVKIIVLYMELLLGTANDPTKPTTRHFIDLTSVAISLDLDVGMLEAIYTMLEQHYPETISKVIVYPVSAAMVKSASTSQITSDYLILRSLLESKLNDRTTEKFLLTTSMDVVCKELGWDKDALETAGGLEAFLSQHNKAAKERLLL
jgi:hypothetical protein